MSAHSKVVDIPVVDEAVVADGRRMRSERSRDAIIEAALQLVQEGILVPTAQQIADRAGVAMRTFFRHFESMESLATAVDEHTRDSYESMFTLSERQGTLNERVEKAVQHRAYAYEQVKDVILSTQAQLWRSDVLAKNYARDQRKLRSDMDVWLPELKSLPREKREAVDAITSFEMWHRLRSQQGLSKKTSIEIVVGLIKNLIQ
jgi:AcrR family transcriptional regulator